MAADIEDNGVQLQMPAMEETHEDFDLDVIVTPGKSSLSNAVMSSVLSSVSSTNTFSEILSRDTLSFPQPRIKEGDTHDTLASMKGLEEISMPDITAGLNFVDSVRNINGVLESVRNFTSSLLGASNETSIESVASWSPEEIGAVVIVSLMVPFILMSNIVVIISVVRFRRLHTPTNYFITSLAAVDIFVAVATPFGIVVEVFNFGGDVRSEDVVLCLLPNRILMMACGVSVLTLAAIAYDRQTALVSPLEYISIMTYKKVIVMVTLTWLYSAFIVWLPLMAGWYNSPSEEAPCSANLIHGTAHVLFLSAIFVPSCIAIFVCYFRIFMVARHHAKAIAAVEFAIHRHLQVKFMIKDTKYAKTLALVIGVFLLLWLPYLIFTLVQAISSTSFNVWVQTYLILLTVFNSGINPWLYAFKNSELRAAFKRLLKELCMSKFCTFGSRRTSLISAISGTPRLSRTDSRIASIIPEVTLSTVDEKLKKSLESLDEPTSECKHDIHDGKQRDSMAILMPPSCTLPRAKQSHRQATSCSNLQGLRSVGEDRVDSVFHSKRFSLDLTSDCVGQTELSSALSALDADYLRLVRFETSTGNNYSLWNGGNISNSSSQSPKTCTPLTEVMSLPLSGIHVQLSPASSSSQRRSSASDSKTSIFSVMDVVDQLKYYRHQHKSSPPHNTILSTEHAETPRQHHLKYTHSVDFLRETAQQSTSWPSNFFQSDYFDAHPHHYIHSPHLATNFTSFPEPITPIVCDQHTSTNTPTHTPSHTLTHTQSCPIFDPITSCQMLMRQLSVDHNVSTHLKEVATVPLEDRLDYVSRINKETDSSRRDRYQI